MVTFNHPLMVIVALSVVPVFLLIAALVNRFQKRTLADFGNRTVLSRFSGFTGKTVPALIISLALSFMALAAAEPSLADDEALFSSTVNTVIVMDVSRSMMAEDGLDNQSRLASGIRAIEALLATYPDGRFGLVIYTDQVFVYPPTFDHQSLLTLLRSIEADYVIRGEGSEPVAALQSAAKMIEDLPYTIDTVILISDGGKSRQIKAASPLPEQVTRQLRRQGIRVVAVGVGGLIPAAIPIYGEDGALVGYHQYEGQTAYTALDETPLQRFAADTSGWYRKLTSPTDLVTLVQSENLDSQPIAQDTNSNLVWLPTAISLLLVALWLHPRISK